MKISVIVPVYNVSKYLSSCIDSIINQTYKNIEIILINDGSIDNSGDICDEYQKKDKRIKVIHQKNMGVSSTRNKGIKLSTGEYLTFVDSDDILNENFIELLVSKVNKKTLTLGKISFFENEIESDEIKENDIKLNKDNLIILAKMYLINSPCCRLYNREILINNNILFDSKLSLGEDLLFNLEYLKYIENVYIVNQSLYYYRRIDNVSLSSKYTKDMKNIQFLLFDRFTDFFSKRIKDEEQEKIFDAYRFGMFIIIIHNEFKNKKVGFFKRYFNCHKILSHKDVKQRLKLIKYPRNKIDYFLVSNNLILMYKIKNKFKNI